MIVAPGSLASSRAAISAVSVDGETARPRSSTRKQRSASPSKARPMSAPSATTRACRSTQVLRLDRVGLVVGEGAVELEVHRHQLGLSRRGVEDGRRGVPGHAVAGVDHDLERAARRPGRGESRCAAYASSTSRWVMRARRSAVGRGRPRATRSRISARPVSMPIGWAPARHILMPLYCAGLWLAVNIAPGVAEVAGGEVELVGRGQPDHHHVGARLGGARGERAGEARRAGPHVVADHDRSSRRSPATKARARARASSSSSWSGTVPRTSYALKMARDVRGVGLAHAERSSSGHGPDRGSSVSRW